MNFRNFLENKNMEDVNDSITKLPKDHQKLVKDYKFIFEPNNTLKGDGGHVGYIDEEKKEIKVAAPWNYGREYAVLHEIGHAVWKYAVNENKKKEWHKLCKKTKGLDQNNEEIFCMVYAQNYAKNKIEKFDHPHLIKFIKTI